MTLKTLFLFLLSLFFSPGVFANFNCSGEENNSASLFIGTSRFGCEVVLTGPVLASLPHSELKTDLGIFEDSPCAKNPLGSGITTYVSILKASPSLEPAHEILAPQASSALAAIKISIDRSDATHITAKIEEFAFIGFEPVKSDELVGITFICEETLN